MAINPEALREIGRMLHGPDFVGAFAEDLGINQRNLQRMLNEGKPIPFGLAQDALALIDARRAKIAHDLGVENYPQDRAE